jgi:hypothetical protein
LALSGVGMVAKAGADAGMAADGLADGADAADSGQSLWVTGLQRTFTPSGIKASVSSEHWAGFGSKLVDNVNDEFVGTWRSSDSGSPAVVTIARVEFTANRLNEGISAAPDFKHDLTGSKVP